MLDDPRINASGPLAVDGREVALLFDAPESSVAGCVSGEPVELLFLLEPVPADGTSSADGNHDGMTLGTMAGR